MKRHFRMTFYTGSLVALLAVLLVRLGLTAPLDQALCEFYGFRYALWQDRQVLDFVLILIAAYGVAWTTLDVTRGTLKTVIAAVALLQLFTLSWVFALYGYFLSPFAPAFALLGSFALGFCYTRTEGGKRKKLLRAIFGDRLSERHLNQLIDAPEPPALEGGWAELTVLHCRLVPLPGDGEQAALNEVTKINRAWQACADYLTSMGAYLDRCDGSTLRALFGAPVPDADHAQSACRAALEIRKRIRNLNADLDPQSLLDLRIGIQSGHAVVGAYGTHRLGGYSAAGECIEEVRKICEANFIYGTRILIGPEAWLLASSEIEARPIEFLRFRSDDPQMEVYELLGLKGSLSPEEEMRRDRFWEGIILYRERRLKEALARFENARGGNGEDAPLDFYIRRIQKLERGERQSQPRWQTTRTVDALD